MKRNKIISTGILLGLAAVICMAVLRGSLSLEGGETKKGGQEKAASVDTGEIEGQESGLSVNEERVEETDAEEGRMYPRINPVLDRADFLAREDIGKNENPENSVPEDLTEELSTALQNNTLEDYVAEISAEYVLLQEDEIMQYIRGDTFGVLESFYYDYIKKGDGEWFLFERDNDIIVRRKIDNEEYPYCYYKFPCEGDGYDMALCAYGKNEDYYFISWDDEDYLLVTKREEGQVNGIAVYHMFDDTYIGWILGLEKQPDGEIEVTYYNYIFSGSGVQGTPFLDY